uniref:Uncharacterized protein n=1 Tax=Arundo donax TaxID=35708 RepID=A0A0A8Z3B7_ARUDO
MPTLEYTTSYVQGSHFSKILSMFSVSKET